MRSAVILLAAGAGLRVGGRTPKQFTVLNGAPMWMVSAATFAKMKSVREMIFVCQPEHRRRLQRTLSSLRYSGVVRVVDGGSFRGASVRNGVAALSTDPDVVLVHDTARPLVSADVVQRVERAAMKHGAALAAWPLPDTLKMADVHGRVKKTIPRQNLWLAQTPQGFRKNVALACLLSPMADATDDVELAERKGFPVRVVQGAPTNFKVTYPTDLKLCRLLLA